MQTDDSRDYGAIPTHTGSSSSHSPPRQPKDGERAWLLGPQSGTGASGSGAGSGSGEAGPARRRNTWMNPGQRDSLLPTHTGSAPDLIRRKDLPGQTA